MKCVDVRARWFGRRWPRFALMLQVLLLTGLCLAANALVARWQLPIPGSILALALVLGLLAMRIVPASGLARGADWLLAEMLLFFIPAVMAISEHVALLRQSGFRIVAVILVGTAVVMTATALIVDVVWRWEKKRAR